MVTLDGWKIVLSRSWERHRFLWFFNHLNWNPSKCKYPSLVVDLDVYQLNLRQKSDFHLFQHCQDYQNQNSSQWWRHQYARDHWTDIIGHLKVSLKVFEVTPLLDTLGFLPFLIFSFSKFLRRDDESSCGCFFRMSIRTLSDEIDPRLLRCTFIIDFEKESRLENLYRILQKI